MQTWQEATDRNCLVDVSRTQNDTHAMALNRVLVPYREFDRAEPYAEALRLTGVEPVRIHVGERPELRDTAGLLLMGGTDVDPAAYGAAIAPETDRPDSERDEVEFRLLAEAIDCDAPVLAICRGLQLLNVARGGTLTQHLPGTARHRQRTSETWRPVHSVTIEPGTLLGSIAGTTHWEVNSRHHQAAHAVGRDLRVAARDTQDGTIEALERPASTFVVAVQWHPEDQVGHCPEQRKLFEAFAAAVERRRF
jgi:gamma-glutamyl-gamma-aminobutyrate hydrolase PuuD